MPSSPRLLALCLILPVAASCGGDDVPDGFEVPEGCQPLLAGADCLLPYPSDFFRDSAPELPSGHRIELQGSAKILVASTGRSADPNEGRVFDGFSMLPSIVALLASPASSEGLANLLDAPGDTLTPAARTLIVEAETGVLVAHYADLDPRSEDPARAAIVLHPLAPLSPKTRYVVALQGILQTDGSPATPPEGFRRLRDREAKGAAALEALEEHYETAIFPVLEAAGVDRAGVQLAWDFTTSSQEHPIADMLRIRELALEWLESNTSTIRIVKLEENPRPEIWRTLQATITGPLFLDSDDPGARLSRDDGGAVVPNGVVEIPFTAQIPRSVRDRFEAGKVLGYGHGFFGGRSEVTEPQTRTIVERFGAVAFALDWWGMAREDVFLVVDGLVNKPDEALIFTDRVHQTMANWIVLTAALDGPIAELAAMHRPTEAGQPGVVTSTGGATNAGALVYDASSLSFLGISQGHILAGVLAAVHPELERVMLHVGGAGFTHMMLRSRSFLPFLTFLADSLPDPLDQQKFVALSQTALDRIDPGIYAPLLLEQPLPGSRPRRVLMQIGLGDVQVPNTGSFLHARALGLPLLDPAPAPIFGLEPRPGPIEGSAVGLYDLGIDLSVYERAKPPTQENVVHDGLRLRAPALEQLATFFERGVAQQFCDGPCDPE